MRLFRHVLWPLCVYLAGALRHPDRASHHLNRDRTRVPLTLSLFFVIDTLVAPEARDFENLRNASRATWLDSVRRAGHDYRFFYLANASRALQTRGLELEPYHTDPDMVAIPVGSWPRNRHKREFHLLRSAFDWAVQQTSADYVVKADHDVYVCVGHLEHVLMTSPRKQFFLGYYWTRQGGCRADQNFLVYSMDALATAVNMTEGCTLPLNWAVTWGRLAKHLWAHKLLTVADDRERIDSQQWYHTRPDEELPATYCSRRVAMHLFPAVLPRVQAPAVMRNLSALERRMKGVPGVAYSPALPIGPPECIKNVSRECLESWYDC